MKNFEEIKTVLNNSSYYYIICTNMEGKYTFANEHYEKVFSKIHGSIVGQPYEITMHEDDTITCKEVATQCFENPDKLFPATIRKHDGHGGYVVTQWEYKAMFDEDNKPAGIFCLGYDVTDYKIKIEKLEDAEDVINQKNFLLKEIAFDQSHVIRRPLANILGIINILDKSDFDQNKKNLIDMLTESSKQLDNVIREIVAKTHK